MSIRELATFAGSVLRLAYRRKVSLDKAFQQAKMPKKVRMMPQKLVYRVVRGVVSDFYLMRHVSKEVYGRSLDPYGLGMLWLYYKGEDFLEGYEGSLRKFRRELRKGMPRYKELCDLLDEASDPEERLAVELSYPRWFVRRLVSLVGLSEAEKILRGLNREVVWVRINTLKAELDLVKEELEESGVKLRKDGDLWYMFEVLDYEEPLHKLGPIKRGEAILQDKASAMVVEALEPEPGDTLLDLTAAPGIKASLFAMLAENRARIFAMDLSLQRLKSARRLLALYGAKNIELLRGDAINPPFLTDKGDKLLLDAPCTSSGAIGRDPAIKLHLEDEGWASKFPKLQARMLKTCIPPKGVLVYATCSVLESEGEEVVKGLKNLLRLDLPGSAGYRIYPFSDKVVRFFPHIHHTEGFFISKFQM